MHKNETIRLYDDKSRNKLTIFI